MSVAPGIIAVNWLNEFAAHLAVGNVEGVTSCFREDGWLRDLLIFTWNNRTLHGTSNITEYLRDTLKPGSFSEFKVDHRPFMAPEKGHITPTLSGVSCGFTFETPIAHGQGFVRLVDDGAGRWKALTVLMSMEDIRGHEEHGYENGMWGDHTLAWGDVKSQRVHRTEEDPRVLIGTWNSYSSTGSTWSSLYTTTSKWEEVRTD